MSAAAAVVASMIGAGVFTTTGFLAADLGHRGAILLIWVVGGAYAAFGALSYGKLARAFPESGGEYIFLSKTVHPTAGWLAGWVSLVVGFSAPAALAASAFGYYAISFFKVDPTISASILLVAAATLHAKGTQLGNRVQVALVLLKIILLLSFIGVSLFLVQGTSGLPTPGTTNPPESWPTMGAMAVALMWVSFSYSGWNAAVYIAEEVQNPERSLPRALLLGTGIVTLLYVFLNISFLKLAPLTKLAGHQDVALQAAQQSGIPWFSTGTAALVALALATSVFAMTQLGPRVYAKMARNGCAPSFLAPKNETAPKLSIYLQTALALILLWSATFDAILTWTGITLSFSTTLTVCGLIRFRGPSLPALAFVALSLCMLFLSIQNRPLEAAWGLFTLCLGWLIMKMTVAKNSSACL